MASGNFVAYYRVSTRRQGRSGLGLEAQRAAVHEYLNGGPWQLVAEFVEVESGKRTDAGRPQLAEALAACRLYGATLVVAKLDRLARNAAFLLRLRDSDVPFVCADMPDVNRLTIGILALVAEHEAEAISQRTKAALQAAKRRGAKLGTPENLRDSDRGRGTQASAAARAGNAARRAADLAPILRRLREEGAVTFRALAHGLNARRIPAPRGGTWDATQVRRVVSRLERDGG